MSSGIYSVMISDANSCQVFDTLNITEPNALALSKTLTDVKCKNGNDGAIDITLTGGTTPYTYLWSNSASSKDLSGLVAGTYSVIITDKNACVIRDTSTLTEPTQLTLSKISTQVKCKNGNDGAIDISISGGVTPYTYLWSNSATTQDINGLIANTYSVIVTDKNTCTLLDTTVITEPTLLSVSINSQNVSCKNGNDGLIDLNVSGGTSPYTYLWNNSSSSEDISNLSAGQYSVLIIDANGCFRNDTINITEPSLLLSNITTSDVLCNGDNTGSIDLSVSGGTSPYSFLWNTSANSEDLANIGIGDYFVIITDANNCILNDTGKINEPSALALNKSIQNVKCKNGNDGEIDITISGGTTPYTYLWNNLSTSEDLTGLSVGTFNVLITDANNCVYRDTSDVMEPSLLESSITINDVLCYGGNDGGIVANGVGGTSPYTYNWSSGENSNSISNKVKGTTSCELLIKIYVST
ncbi:MAG: SprB repeat-containing protein [Bacteroidia bacterium]